MGATRETWTGSSKASTVIKTQIPANEDRYEAIKTEVEAARKTEASLLAQINAILAAISSAAGGTYSLVSLTDDTNGVLNDKITSTGGTLTKTIASPGGNEKLNFDVTRFGLTATSSAVDITLTSASTLTQQITMTAAGKFVTMPAATGLLKSEEWNFFNAGNFRFGIKDSTGTFIGSIDAQSFGRLKLIDNSTAAGTWEAIDGADLIMARLKTVCNAMASTYVASCKMTSTTVFTAWTGTAGDGYCAMLTWVPGTPEITISNLLEFDTTDATHISCCRMTDTVAIVSYAGPDSDGYIAAITYNGVDTLVATHTYEFLNTDTVTYTQVVPIYAHASSGKIGLTYVKVDTYLYGQVLNWTGTEITANTAETAIYNSAAVTFQSLDIFSGAVGAASMIVTCTSGSTCKALQIAWNGTTLTPSTVLDMVSVVHSSCVVALNSSYAVVCMGLYTGAQVAYEKVAEIIYWSGTALSMKKSISISKNTTRYEVTPREAFLLDSSTVCWFVNSHGSYQSKIWKIKAVGNTDSLQCVLKLDSEIYAGVTGLYHSFAPLDGAGALALSNDSANSNYLTAMRIDIA